ncbi:MAG: hypothetical protein OEY31_05455 [Candidatus Bathyarchaeota archaeon]|nr:hypothetical protein [Candidatus Bathyarchaeota archaeon]
MKKYKILWPALFTFILTVCLGYYFRPVVEEGVVAAKSITGERNNVHYTIISFHELGVNPKIDDWESLFPNTTSILEEAESQLKTRYTDLRYIINIRGKPKTMGYYASKDDFNKVDPGDAVKFKFLRKKDPTIKIIGVMAQGE